MAIYRKLYPRIWNHPRFRALTTTQRLLTLEILTAQVNRLGVFVWHPTMAAEHLGIAPADLEADLPAVLEAWGWEFDPGNRVMWVKSWLQWNQPPNPKAWKGWLKDLEEVPKCALVQQFLDHVAENVTDSKGYPLDTVCHTHSIPYRPGIQLRPYQDQYQEQEQEQDQEEEVFRSSEQLDKGAPRNGVAGPTSSPSDALSANGTADPGTGAMIRGLWIEAHTRAGRRPPRFISSKDDEAAAKIQAQLLAKYTAPEVRDGFARIAATYLNRSKARTPTLAKLEPDLEHWWSQTESEVIQ